MTTVSPDPEDGASHLHGNSPFCASAVPTARGRSAIATTDELASTIGATVLEEGGTAVDAAIAATFALSVVNPEAAGIGGSGFLLIRSPSGEVSSLDFRSTAPRYSSAALLEALLQGRPDPTLVGPLAVAVPGVVAGLGELHRRFGTRPWSSLVSPSVDLATGFTAGDRLVRSFSPSVVEKLQNDTESSPIFLPGGRPPQVGEEFRQPDLAATLARIRDRGAVEFYQGETAERIVSASTRSGGVLSHDDLVRYRPYWAQPVRVRYRGRTIVSTPPPSSGGVILALMAGMLNEFDLAHAASDPAGGIHLRVEASRRAYADRNRYLGDPAFEALPLPTLLDPHYGRWRAKSIGEYATPSKEVSPGVDEFHEGEHTTHLSVMDREGWAISLTLTLNTWYGSGMTPKGTGVLLNCDIDDFTRPDRSPNYFGLEQGRINRIAPGKRMLSAMAPTMVFGREGTEDLLWVVGTPGGATIPTTTFQVLSHLIDGGRSPSDAIAAPRFHHQHLPDRIEYEPGGMSPEIADGLRKRGHELMERVEAIGDIQMISVEPDGSLAALSDPRRGGRPRAV